MRATPSLPIGRRGFSCIAVSTNVGPHCISNRKCNAGGCSCNHTIVKKPPRAQPQTCTCEANHSLLLSRLEKTCRCSAIPIPYLQTYMPYCCHSQDTCTQCDWQWSLLQQYICWGHKAETRRCRASKWRLASTAELVLVSQNNIAAEVAAKLCRACVLCFIRQFTHETRAL